MHIPRRIALGILAAPALAGPVGRCLAATDAAPQATAVVEAARAAIVDLGADRDFEGLRSSLSDARGVLIFPRVFAAGLVLGGAGGNGVLMVRNDRTGDWNGPVFYTLGGVSMGVEAGAFNGSLVLVARSEKALDSLYRTSTRLGANATVALGTKAATAAKATRSDFVVYSKVKGLFAGVAVDGVVLDVRETFNRAYYGKSMTPSDMVLQPAAATPSADGLRAALRAVAH